MIFKNEKQHTEAVQIKQGHHHMKTFYKKRTPSFLIPTDKGNSSLMIFLSFPRIQCKEGPLFIYLWLMVCGLLVPQPGTAPAPLALEVWSLNQWSASQVPRGVFLIWGHSCTWASDPFPSHLLRDFAILSVLPLLYLQPLSSEWQQYFKHAQSSPILNK